MILSIWYASHTAKPGELYDDVIIEIGIIANPQVSSVYKLAVARC